MRNQYVAVLIVIFFQITATAQNVSYSSINMSAVARNANMTYKRNLQFLFDSFAGYDLNEKEAKKEKEQEALQISMLQKNFNTREKYPDSIATGWHTVALTDNKVFYKNAKVFVAKNTILQLVIEDCIRIPCTSKDHIKNAVGAVTLNDINTEYEVLYVYFINDLDSTSLIDEPMQPGYVCFWTFRKEYLHERVIINGIIRDFINKLHEEQPECMEPALSFYILKPGKYKLRVTRTGNDREASFEVKSGMCLRYRL
ncbi:MAG TPA: hypothetical protein VFW07_08485 [Parafilimonas sp.]|nr:hypothetical protein [Parafilimonas sp.]